MPESLAYLNATTHVFTLPQLRNALLPGYISTATVTVSLADAVTGIPIVGQAWPAALDYVASSNGDYSGTLDADLVVTVGQRLRATVLAVAGSVQRTWVVDVVVQEG
jgi:hypothetical protein